MKKKKDCWCKEREKNMKKKRVIGAKLHVNR